MIAPAFLLSGTYNVCMEVSLLRSSSRLQAGFLLLLVAWVICFPSSLWTQPRTPPRPVDIASDYIVDHWLSEDGLPQNSINAIQQTRDGYLWLTTYDGLVRFNGVEFKVFNGGTVPEMKSNRTLALCEDRNGTLWIGTERGGLLSYREGVFRSYTSKDGLADDVVVNLYEDSHGTLWVGTSQGGVSRIKNGEFLPPLTTEDGLNGNLAGAFFEESNGTIWIGTDRGINRIVEGRILRDREFPEVLVTSITGDSRGSIWVCTSSGLYRWRSGRWARYTEREGLLDHRLSMTKEDRDGNLWIGTWSGINVLVEGTWRSYSWSNGSSYSDVKAIYQDREHNIWLGTNGGGLLRLKKRNVRVLSARDGIAHDIILPILQDRSGSMWIGTNCGGVTRIKDGVFTTFTTKNGLTNDCVWSLCEDSEGAIWIGTWGGGVSRYKNGIMAPIGSSIGLPNDVVFSMYEDRQRNLWFGTAAGLKRYRNGSITKFTIEHGLPHNEVRVITEDRSGALWFGTLGGVARYKDGTFTSYTTQEGLSHGHVRAIYEDRSEPGTLWIGTYGGGLNRFKDGTFSIITVKEGLFDNGVFHILEDERGWFWMSCNQGIFRVKKDELVQVANGIRSTVTSVAYGKSEGMLNKECNGGFQPAGWKATNGTFWFPTVKGVVVIDPNRITENPIQPTVVIEHLLVEGSDFVLSAEPKLPPGRDRFELHYAALTFSARERTQYRFKLEGYDRDWVNAGNRRVAYYTNIPPGVYTFRVIAANEDGVWNMEGAALRFEVEPFFYQTRVFYALCAVGVIGIWLAFYFARVRHLIRQNEELEERVALRTEEVVEQKNKLARVNEELNSLLARLEQKSRQLELSKVRAEEANNAKSQFLAIVSHELRTPLNSVIGFTNILLKRKRGKLDEEDLLYLERILENGKHLLTLINGVLDLSKIEAGKGDLMIERVCLNNLIRDTVGQLEGRLGEKDIRLFVDLPPEEVFFHTDQGKLKQILINLLGNAIKFTDHGSIHVRLIVHPETSIAERIDVIDTGIGIPVDRQEAVFEPFGQADSSTTRRFGGTGLGLTISRRFADLLGYRLALKSEEGKGSTFSIILTENSYPFH
jgi:signal transduction histidine kinase/ligand-binding sensor domain-containing protein